MSPDYGWQMEEVLDLDAEPDEPRYPHVWFDESPVQLTREPRHPLPTRPGPPERDDTDYKRAGPANRLLFVQPVRGWRHGHVTKPRTQQDVAQ